VRRNLTIVFAVVISAVLSFAQPLAGQRPASSDTLPTVLLPPDLDRVLRDYERAWRARDAGGLAALFTEDGFVLSGGAPPVRGRAKIQARYAGSGGPLHLRAIAFAADDTVGYIIGTYGASPAEINAGKFVLALRRQPGGQWQIAADMDNPSSAPLRRVPSRADPGLDRR
jgi:uncharacterized protein (TIGR02246 family)